MRITNGSSIAFLKYDDQIQVSSVETASLRIINPAFDAEYDIVPAAITAARQLNLPLLTATDTLVVLALAQTLTNKTLTAPTVNNPVIPATEWGSATHTHLSAATGGVIVGTVSNWTPGIAFGGGTTGITYGVQVGRYFKVGRILVAQGRVTLTNKGSSTGTATITGLPETSLNVANAFSMTNMRLDNVSFSVQYAGQVGVNATVIDLIEATAAGVVTSLTDVDFTNTSEVVVTAVYITDS